MVEESFELGNFIVKIIQTNYKAVIIRVASKGFLVDLSRAIEFLRKEIEFRFSEKNIKEAISMLSFFNILKTVLMGGTKFEIWSILKPEDIVCKLDFENLKPEVLINMKFDSKFEDQLGRSITTEEAKELFNWIMVYPQFKKGLELIVSYSKS